VNVRYQPIAEDDCRYKSQNQFPADNGGKLSAEHVNGLSAICSLQQEPHGYGQATYFGLSRFKKTSF
jgi:hypothetical protein